MGAALLVAPAEAGAAIVNRARLPLAAPASAGATIVAGGSLRA